LRNSAPPFRIFFAGNEQEGQFYHNQKTGPYGRLTFDYASSVCLLVIISDNTILHPKIGCTEGNTDELKRFAG
jgi:hypothetical protein